MYYAVGAAFNLKHLFMNFKHKKLAVSCEVCRLIVKNNHKEKLAQKIFKECLKLVLNDCIDNNVTFELPTGAKKSTIHVKRYYGDEFKQCRRFGKFKDVDFLASNFSGYLLELTMYGNGRLRTKCIYVNKELKNKLTENTNKGKQYC